MLSYDWVYAIVVSIVVGTLIAFLIWKTKNHTPSKIEGRQILSKNQRSIYFSKFYNFKQSIEKYNFDCDFKHENYLINDLKISNTLKDQNLTNVIITNRSFLRKLKGLPETYEFKSTENSILQENQTEGSFFQDYSTKQSTNIHFKRSFARYRNMKKPRKYLFLHKNESREKSKFFLKIPPILVKNLRNQNFRKAGTALFSRKVLKNEIETNSHNAMKKVDNRNTNFLASSKIVENKINKSKIGQLKMDQEKVLSIYEETAKIDELQRLEYLKTATKFISPATEYQTKAMTDYKFTEMSTISHSDYFSTENEPDLEDSTLLFTLDWDVDANLTSSSLVQPELTTILRKSLFAYSTVAPSLIKNLAKFNMDSTDSPTASILENLAKPSTEFEDSSIAPLKTLITANVELKESSIAASALKILTKPRVQFSSTISSKIANNTNVSKNITTRFKTKQNETTPNWLKLITENLNAWTKCTEKNVSILSEEEDSLDLETYISYDKISFNETFFSHPSLVSLATVAYVMKIILLVLFCSGILFLALIIIAFAKVKETHGFSYLKDHLTYSLISVFGSETQRAPTLTLISPSSSSTSLISLPTVLEEASRDPKEAFNAWEMKNRRISEKEIIH
ncbi:uncharacterized protein [Parasteatoda tepidariorum]|uniref:uncharacterized protein n=1 Tax=Parasteatoda tepidariorum TaxID=114398 RepID=UPI0039BCA5A5